MPFCFQSLDMANKWQVPGDTVVGTAAHLVYRVTPKITHPLRLAWGDPHGERGGFWNDLVNTSR